MFETWSKLNRVDEFSLKGCRGREKNTVINLDYYYERGILKPANNRLIKIILINFWNEWILQSETLLLPAY